ncbi:MAG: hypothetical protein AAGG54_02655 [Pseudomonadota bacterium]
MLKIGALRAIMAMSPLAGQRPVWRLICKWATPPTDMICTERECGDDEIADEWLNQAELLKASVALSAPFVNRAWAETVELTLLGWFGTAEPDMVAEFEEAINA